MRFVLRPGVYTYDSITGMVTGRPRPTCRPAQDGSAFAVAHDKG